MTTPIIFLIILGILVLVHEFGHFIVAKISKVKVEEFAFGFPPTLWSKTKGETKYMINAIPFGGYVKLLGEDGANLDDPRSFSNKSHFVRAAIIVAGITMNLILGGLFLGIAFMIGMPTVSDNYQKDYPYAQVQTGIVAYEINNDSDFSQKIIPGDKIVSIDGQAISSVEQFKSNIQNYKDQEINLQIQRKKELLNISGHPNFSEANQAYQVGIVLTEEQTIKYPFYLAIPMGFVEMFRLLKSMIVALYGIVVDLIITHQAPVAIAGPVGIYQIAAAASEMGLVYLIQLTSLLSINLALINILPIPALDGGRLLFIVLEKIRGKKISANLENIVHTAGFVVIIGIILLVTISDIKNLF